MNQIKKALPTNYSTVFISKARDYVTGFISKARDHVTGFISKATGNVSKPTSYVQAPQSSCKTFRQAVTKGAQRWNITFDGGNALMRGRFVSVTQFIKKVC